jgi:hypothetical protein
VRVNGQLLPNGLHLLAATGLRIGLTNNIGFELPEEKTRRSRSGRSQRYNQLQIIKIITRGMGQVTSNKNDTQSGNQLIFFLVRSLESDMPYLLINCDRFSSVSD